MKDASAGSFFIVPSHTGVLSFGNRISIGSKVPVFIKRTSVRNIRFYHRTLTKEVPEWLSVIAVKVVSFFGKKAIAPAPATPPIALFPNAGNPNPIKPIIFMFNSALASFKYKAFWTAFSGITTCIVVGHVGLLAYSSRCDWKAVVEIHSQIVMNTELINSLNISYPVLNEFNENAARFVERKACGRLTYEDCQLIIKYSIRYKNNIIFKTILVDIDDIPS